MSWKVRVMLALLLTVVAAIAWLHYPPARYASQVDKILKDRPSEFSQRIAQFGNDPQSNMFLDPKVRELWTLPSQISSGQIQPGTVNTTVDDFQNFDPRGDRRPLNQLQAFHKEKDLKKPAFDKARANFQKLLPDIQDAISKPEFVTGVSRLSILREMPDFTNLRRVTRSLSLEAYLLLLEDKCEPALELIAGTCSLQPKIQQGEPHVIGAMMGATFFGTGIDPIFRGGLLHRSVSDSALKKFEERLQQQEVPLEQDARCFEYELVGFHETVAQGPKVLAQSGLAPIQRALMYLFFASGVVDRECRLYDNDVIPIVEDTRLGHPVNSKFLQTSSPWIDDFRGKHGRLALEFIANFERAQSVLVYARTLNRLARICSATKRYHNLKDSWPTKIEDLATVQFKLPDNPLSSQPFALQSSPTAIKLIVPKDSGWSFGQLLAPGPLSEEGANLVLIMPLKETAPK